MISMLFIFPEAAGAGAAAGLKLTGTVLIPSLFTFTVLSVFLINSQTLRFLERPLSVISRALFRSNSPTALLMSFIGGFPVGAKLLSEEYKNGCITENELNARLCCGVNPGPAFVITAVGCGMLKSAGMGTVLFAAVTGASVMNGIIFSRALKISPIQKAHKRSNTTHLTSCFVESVYSSSISMLQIAAFTVLFSVIIYILKEINLGDSFFIAAAAILEVTTGTSVAITFPLPVIAAVIGFGGLSVHFQVLSALSKAPVNLKVFFTSRISHGAMSFLFAKLLLIFVPISKETVLKAGNISGVGDFSLPLTLSMMLMCLTLIVTAKENLSK